VADAESGEICATTESDMIDKNLNEIGIIETTTETDTTVSKVLEIEGHRNYCNFTNTGEYIIVVACAASASVKNFIVPMVIEFVYLMLASVIIVYTLNRLLKANDERDTQMAVLASMSDIYNSMHLIDLERNTVVEYNARFNVSETEGADRVLKELITLKTEEDYCEDALVFTDIHTITDRMQNKKIISEEFMSKDIGWYRSSFITIETNEEGYPTKVIYVIQNIDKQKKKEEELIFKSNVDELTGLYNRRAYDEDVEEHNGIVTEEDFVFVSLDVNGLKTVNDGMGHVAGDDLLIGAANCMKQCFEPYGKVYRVGGDEFIAIIFANEIQLQSIKRSFEEATDKWTGNLVDSLSVSCGYVAKREVNTTSIREIANMADKKMYKVKSEFYRRSAK
jgi:diguanylate cyclase (GGDEF)-like protein